MRLTLVRLFLGLVGLTIVFGFSFGWWSKQPASSNTPVSALEDVRSRATPDSKAIHSGLTPSQVVSPSEDSQPTPTAVPAEHRTPSLQPSPRGEGSSDDTDTSPGNGADTLHSSAFLDAGSHGHIEQACANSSDCPPGQGCIFEASRGRMVCRPSGCDSDQDCPDSKVCRIANDVSTGTPIRRCTQPGERKEGDACHNLSSDISQTCQAGLLCVKGRCGRSCEKNAIGGCPGGSICVDTPEGSGCFPTCREGQCQLGQECIQLDDVAFCATPIGRNCLKHGCGQGMGCDVTRRMDTVIFECRQHCSPIDLDTCPQSHVCGAGSGGQSFCYQDCDFAEHPCPQGYECYTVAEDLRTLGCRRTGP